jgi:nucleotide-binding universal stress UspA family protein
MFKHIIVGVDGREGGRDAVALARLLVAVGGKLTLAYVVAPDPHAYRGTNGAPEASDGGRAKALLEAARGGNGCRSAPPLVRILFCGPRPA